MEISIIIPVYNCEEYLERCVESIIAQTITDWEAWLIDDGSQDHGGAICQQYANRDSRIHYLKKDHEGQGAARNLGIKLSKGKYIAFLDADDWWRMDALEQLYNCAVNENCDLVLCDHYIVEGNPQNPSFRLDRLPIRISEVVNLSQRPELMYRIEGALWDKLYKRKLWDGILQPAHFYEDSAILPVILERAERIGQVKEPLIYYWSIRNNSTVNRNDTVYAIKSCLEEIKDSFVKAGKFECYKNELRKYSHWLYLVAFNHVNRLLVDSKEEQIKYNKFLTQCDRYIEENYPAQYQMNQINFVIWGSYNLRSQVNRSKENVKPVTEHYCFSSIISIMGQRIPFKNTYHHSNSFRDKMLQQDLGQDFLHLSNINESFVICIDLLEERYSLAEIEGNLVTASEALLESVSKDKVMVSSIEDEKHFNLWKKSAVVFIAYLKSVFRTEQIILIENYLNGFHGIYNKDLKFTDHSKICRTNSFLKKCYDFFRENFPGIHVIRNHDPELEYSDDLFPHGCFPWHQNEYLYHDIADQIDRFLLTYIESNKQ